jgi:hypothetical protein
VRQSPVPEPIESMSARRVAEEVGVSKSTVANYGGSPVDKDDRV